jgi:hypothetical protein
MIPEHLSAAISQAHVGPRESVRVDRAVSAGDIRQLSLGSIDRLVLVLKVSPESNTSQFTLVHSYCEFATEHDIVIEPVVTGLSYEMVVQTDLRAVVSTAELGRFIAVVPSRVVSACFEGPITLIEDDSMFVGPAMLGPLDARWDFKVEEGETIRELSSSSIESFDNPEIQWVFEFDEIFTALLLPVDDAPAMAVAMFELWLVRGDSLAITPEHLVLFDDRGLLSRDTWSGALGESGIHFFDSVMTKFIEQARSSFNVATKLPEQIIGLSELRELQYA